MTDGVLRARIRQLEQQLAKKDSVIAGLKALLADRDAQIAKLAADVATLQSLVNTLMARRGGSLRIPEGQGLLFGNGEPDAVDPDGPKDEAKTADDGGNNDADSPPAKPPAKGTKRRPGKLDTTGLRRTREIHDLPEDQRVDPASGKNACSDR